MELRVLDRVDQRQAVAELGAGAPRELEVVALLELAARLEEAAEAVRPAGDVLRLEVPSAA